jgi:hypothetical protein
MWVKTGKAQCEHMTSALALTTDIHSGMSVRCLTKTRISRARDPVRSSPPKVLETPRRQFGISHGVLNVLVAEIGLKRPRVMPL